MQAYLVVIMAFGIVNQWVTPVDNAKILAVETIAGKSHWNFMRAVLRSLTDAGHTITVFTPFPEGNRENYTEVDMSESFPKKLELDILYAVDSFGRPLAFMDMLMPLIRYTYCEVIYGNIHFDEILRGKSNSDFDLIIVEPLFYDCMSHLATTLNLPIIYVIPSPMITTSERIFTGHFSNPAYVPHQLGLGIPKTFVQRFINTAIFVYGLCSTTFNDYKLKKTDPRQYDSHPFVSPSIIFQNTHYITEGARPVTPNLIDIGGIHLTTAQSIPKDILDFIEDSPHGVIYFTFGSTIKMSSLPNHIEMAFKEAIAQIPQRVLWKYEDEMNDKPKNVMIRKWFPQREILLHPKVKLFISHGGIGGVYEALDVGVPVLGFPLFYDQGRNIEHLVHADMAISMDLFKVTKDTLLKSILELLNNKKYMVNAKLASERFKDRPMTPQQSVVYWTEYVIRHKGAPHLKSHGLNLTWYQYMLLDVIAVMLIIIFAVLFICYKLLKFINRFTFKKGLEYVKLKIQ